MPDTPDYDSDDRPDARAHRTRVNIVVSVIMVVLIGGGLWLAHVLAEARRVQDCVFSGRTNCVPIDTQNSGG